MNLDDLTVYCRPCRAWISEAQCRACQDLAAGRMERPATLWEIDTELAERAANRRLSCVGCERFEGKARRVREERRERCRVCGGAVKARGLCARHYRRELAMRKAASRIGWSGVADAGLVLRD